MARTRRARSDRTGAPQAPIRRFLAAMIIALGLSFAQPAISPGELFRVGHAEIVRNQDARRDRHRATAGDAEPMPAPEAGVRWYLVLWTAADFDESSAVSALARGDPRPMA